MKVLNLRCGHGHGFEGWFASEDDYQSQRGRALVTCPMCGDAEVDKMPSAPRLNLSGARDSTAPARRPGDGGRAERTATGPAKPGGDRATGAGAGAAGGQAPAVSPATAQGAALPAEVQAMWMQAVQQVMAQTEDVGKRFPEEARRIHYGESPERGIRGEATREEREELAEEGIEVMALPLPPGMKGPLQ